VKYHKFLQVAACVIAGGRGFGRCDENMRKIDEKILDCIESALKEPIYSVLKGGGRSRP